VFFWKKIRTSVAIANLELAQVEKQIVREWDKKNSRIKRDRLASILWISKLLILKDGKVVKI
jgi:hypothetical protein